MMPITEDQEAWIIQYIHTHCGGSAPLGIGDDAAIPPIGDGQLLISTDTMVEGVHWDDRLSPSDVGWKLMAVNASDLGAMGARPSWALLNLSLPAPLEMAWVRAFVAGLAEASRHFRLPIIGGDTTRAPTRVLGLTVGGYARRPVTRAGGRPGDEIWVSGPLGRAAAGFYGEDSSWLRRPMPPVALGAALGEAGLLHAMMDLSDGLHKDLKRLCAASNCGAQVFPELIPGVSRMDWRVSFGEDYELLFVASPEQQDAIVSVTAMQGVSATRIGVLTAALSVELVGQSWPDLLFDHFPGGLS